MSNAPTAVWWIAQVIAAFIGGALWAKYGWATGMAVGYALLLLADIRFELARATKGETP